MVGEHARGEHLGVTASSLERPPPCPVRREVRERDHRRRRAVRDPREEPAFVLVEPDAAERERHAARPHPRSERRRRSRPPRAARAPRPAMRLAASRPPPGAVQTVRPSPGRWAMRSMRSCRIEQHDPGGARSIGCLGVAPGGLGGEPRMRRHEPRRDEEAVGIDDVEVPARSTMMIQPSPRTRAAGRRGRSAVARRRRR
jgi:hypothetical protein